ncbi:LysR family transcriptional regulator [Paraburkholderia sp. MMS20-SJTR3]|uniref:LysR family transcriptional regulator n=1 Tax=Paraburkholderia sejongensis TaxID=2886946 RepID=A0ABS8JRF7_9BURK|nr:LysR substrate-binding domain-containing protein [Paraburkholderia sp. MMS20-SJTR3]MCC8392479.1 LysR family transcriptional regulator [Paraburkholderia sp. MMS20-SJTR3]
MKHNQLRALVAIAEHGSLRAAAKTVCLSQPALTKAIRELEQDLGVTLVARSARGAQLTPFGRAIYTRAKLILAEMQHARDDVYRLSGTEGGVVSCAVTPLISLKYLPRAIRMFRQRMTTTRLSVHEGFLTQAMAGVRDGTLDFAIVVLDDSKLSNEFQFRPLLEARLMISARKGHPLADARSIFELGGAQWMLNTTPESIGRVLQDYFVDMGAGAPRVVMECSSFSGSFSMSANSDLLSCCPQSFLESPWFNAAVVAIPVAESLPQVTVGIVSRRDALNTAACDYLIDCFAEAVAALPPFEGG